MRLSETAGHPALRELLRLIMRQEGGNISFYASEAARRLADSPTFAKLCGVSPLDASSSKQVRHRLNRSGDRQANSALWHIVFTRMVNDPRTRHYIERRMKDGRTKKEAVRCLKRYVAREVFATLPRS